MRGIGQRNVFKFAMIIPLPSSFLVKNDFFFHKKNVPESTAPQKPFRKIINYFFLIFLQIILVFSFWCLISFFPHFYDRKCINEITRSFQSNIDILQYLQYFSFLLKERMRKNEPFTQYEILHVISMCCRKFRGRTTPG